jgi:heavy metal sensor kinase
VSLTNRLLAFFLTLLAVVLASFSLTLYLLAREYLHGIVVDRLDGALDTLAAAAEVRPGGVEWEPAERQLSLRGARAEDTIVWAVCDPDGKVVDRSRDPIPSEAERLLTGKRLELDGERWQFRQRWVEPSSTAAPLPKPDEKGERVFPRLSLVVGSSLEPVRSTLRWLAGTLAGLSLAVWALSFALGRWVCGRALAPVRKMAEATRSIGGADLAARLPAAGTHDEVDDLGRAFNDLLARLQESFERQRRFTAEASHQLRTPLTAMLGQVEVVLRRDRSPEEYAQVLTSVHDQGERLAKIVESLLFLARADSEARAPDLARIDLREWLAKHAATWSADRRGADLALDVAGVEPLVAAVQPMLLGELVNNLWENAAKFSPPGSPIAVRLQASDRDIRLTVEDRGPGISADDLPHVFEPFFRSTEARRRGVEGIGLGLAIGRRIAASFGGTLTVDQANSGTRFTLTLPRER